MSGSETPTQTEIPGLPARLYSASPSKLSMWLDCPRAYRMRYLDRPSPPGRAQRAHTSVGLVVHNVLRDFWDLPEHARTPDAVRELVRTSWIDVGFRDAEQSARWRARITDEVLDYLRESDRSTQPAGIERTVGLKTATLALTGRIDRLDDRDGELVVVDYKTSRRPLGRDDARTSLALAFYAQAVARLFRRACTRVEPHHVPTREVVAHEHTPESLERKAAEAESIGRDLRAADASYAKLGVESPVFAPRPSALCRWCDYRRHCPEGQLMGPEQQSWAALEP
ncbi:PD-(D/E)XK nuclease family protein [Allobranchiibius sp. GilTou38]|uniref:RecB family exonuclease n=1 Tax=Allobranchiibius sp. GilTou38 TaxID=2815210 RepID=UPI001AA14393|nr:PD-(D/E)XK nuclease family protein [Allobranchiibius sp. GilTou38]MBO1765835.1 PD-(D/E)XK nuclease family protein [Allobranchiibius sp. GilTou38]